MKKVLAVLLIMAMLIPMGLAVPAKAEEIKKEPIYVLSWTGFDQSKYPFLKGLATPSFSNIGENIKLTYGGFGMQYGSYDDADVTGLANYIKTTMEARPAGMRYLHIARPGTMYGLAPEHAIFMDFHVAQMAKIMDDLLAKMKKIGAPLDGIVIDTEYIGLSTHYLVDTNSSRENLVENPNLLKDIVKDKRYKTRIRPLLEEYGFIFYDAGDPVKQASYTELYSITKNAGEKYERSRLVWNTVMRIHLNTYANEWLYTPLQKHYPEAHCSDYQSMDGKSWLKLASVADDGTVMDGGNTIKVGNTSTYSFYYTRPSSADLKALSKVSGFNEAYFAKEPFTGFMYDINFARYMYNSSDTKRISPWTSSYFYQYTGAVSVSSANTPYYADLIYHLGMFNPQPFLFYNTKAETEKVGGPTGWDKTGHILNDILTVLNDLAGYADRKPIEMPLNWNSKFVLTGMYCGGRNLWRITPNDNVISRGGFLIDEETPTFYVNGETVTFPGGKILPEAPINDGEGNEVGSVGYWVETAKDVMPIVTAEEDRYEAYPSLKCDFENYAIGVFDYNTSQPTNGWGFTWGKTTAGMKGESNITSIDGNKVLSIIGNSKNFLKTLPSNITAGDTFAEDQAWELSVTIPAGLSKDAVITLLDYTGKKQDIADGGFMIKDGKLYYATGEVDAEEEPVYAELMEVEADETYIFKRLMDFNNKDAFTSTFVVCNRNGRELKRVEDVPAPGFATIDTVGFGVAEADKAVFVDDFKMYLTGATLDFSIYDVKSGNSVELNTTRDRATAYRLSWLNATMEEETAYIKADITENGKTTTTVIKEIKMLPGTDRIETGVVQVKEGQTVKIYLEDTLHPVASADEAGPLVDATFNEGGIQKVPSALKNLGLDSIEKIKEALEGKLKEAATDGVETVAHYDIKVNKNDIPRHGKMTVIMPYPQGTDANYTFYAAQLYTANAYGKKAGDVATVTVINTAEGIQFEIYGTSPVAIGWSEPVVEDPADATVPTRTPNQLERPVGTRITRPTEAPEIEETEEPTEATEYIEDTEPTEEPTEAPTETAPVATEEGGVNIVLIIVIAVVVLAGAGAAVFFLLKKKNVAAPVAEEIEDIEEPEAPEEKTEE